MFTRNAIEGARGRALGVQTSPGAVLAGLLFSLFSLLPAAPAQPSATPVRFVPQWIPQAQFAGYFMAVEKGYYSEQGIDITLLRGGPDAPPGTLLSGGEATFATMMLSQALEKRAQGVPVVNIAQITQRSALMIVARRNSGITSPRDLDKKKISIWQDYRAQPLALFRKLEITPTVVPQNSTLNLFLRGGVDAASVMWYNEYHLILNAGIDVNDLTVMFYNEYGLNFPEDGIYCLRGTLDADRDLCCRFVQASVKGWNYAFDHMGEALEVVMRRAEEAHTGTNYAHQRWMLARMKDLIHPAGGTHPLGYLDPGDYATAAEELKRCGIIQTIPPLEEFHAACIQEN